MSHRTGLSTSGAPSGWLPQSLKFPPGPTAGSLLLLRVAGPLPLCAYITYLPTPFLAIMNDLPPRQRKPGFMEPCVPGTLHSPWQAAGARHVGQEGCVGHAQPRLFAGSALAGAASAQPPPEGDVAQPPALPATFP